ncbi:MAG: 30S ribosomal protein S12 methylthiotransferase RimO [candidate division WOR-3 bacterium]|nr:MAG: 30S ribosomal protein S12 methylthiotransferase RimO [candidate division WOR-3 bacterium]
MRIHCVSLGCPKNLVDSENIIGVLGASGASITPLPEDCDVMILNTCAFIKPALEETQREIENALHRMSNGKRLFVLGCAVNRFGRRLRRQFPQVSGWYEIKDIPKLIKALAPDAPGKRTRLPTTHGYAYLKISEGCSNNCTYCTIPSIKGPYRSITTQELLAEARELAGLGIKELILIGQDTTRYGMDTGGQTALRSLLRRLSLIEGIEWIRIMYAHPKTIDDDILQEIEQNDKICKYIDLPIQHVSSRILKRMKRGTTAKSIENVLKTLKKIIGFSVRTTLIVGFPGETDAEFNELMQFVDKGYFDWLGVFPYHCEEGTEAAKLVQTPEKIIRERYEKAVDMQQRIIARANRKRLNRPYRVLVHSFDGHNYIGHAEFNAPDIDSQILVKGDNLQPGKFYDVRIADIKDGDLISEPVEVGD